MALTPDQIVDRINLKKQVMNWRFISLACLLILLFSLFNTKAFNRVSGIDGQYIARIVVEGLIYDEIERIENIKKLSNDKLVKGVIVHINTPGGTAVGGENIHAALRKISKNKPVVVVMGDVAASAGYMIATAGDYLIAHESTITGSIGVIAQTFEVTELAEKLGIRFHNFKTSPLKGGPIPTEKLSPEMQEAMTITIEDIYEMFVTLVSKRRNIPMQTLLPLADGRVYTGRQALKFGLIDAIGDEDTAFDWIVSNQKLNNNIKVIDYQIEPVESQFDRLVNNFTSLTTIVNTLLNNNLTYYY